MSCYGSCLKMNTIHKILLMGMNIVIDRIISTHQLLLWPTLYFHDQQWLFFISLHCRCCNVFTWSAVPFLHQSPLQMLQCIYMISSAFSSPAFTADVAMYLHDQQCLFFTSIHCRCCNVFTWSAVPFLHQPSLQMLQCIYMISSAFSSPASTADVAIYLLDQQCLFFTNLHCRCCNVFTWSAVPFLHPPSLQMLQCIYLISSAFSSPASTADVAMYWSALTW